MSESGEEISTQQEGVEGAGEKPIEKTETGGFNEAWTRLRNFWANRKGGTQTDERSTREERVTIEQAAHEPELREQQAQREREERSEREWEEAHKENEKRDKQFNKGLDKAHTKNDKLDTKNWRNAHIENKIIDVREKIWKLAQEQAREVARATAQGIKKVYKEGIHIEDVLGRPSESRTEIGKQQEEAARIKEQM